MWFWIFWVLDNSAVNGDILLTLDLQSGVIASIVDSISTSPRCLTA
jgi:hypothetical protein